jgi:hypothetical protein
MEQGSALTAKGRAARGTAATWMCECLGLTNKLHTTATAGAATNEVNRGNVFAHEPANVKVRGKQRRL